VISDQKYQCVRDRLYEIIPSHLDINVDDLARVLVALTTPSSQQPAPVCCWLGCSKAAEFDLYDKPLNPNCTQSCAEHVEQLKSDSHGETVIVGWEPKSQTLVAQHQQ
jgi:hypothetical protein